MSTVNLGGFVFRWDRMLVKLKINVELFKN